MEIRNLQTFPAGHPPSPYFRPVADPDPRYIRRAILGPHLTLCAVGWLGAKVPTRGTTPPECIDRLVQALGSAEVIWEGMSGAHSCEICEALGTYFPGTDEFSSQLVSGYGVTSPSREQIRATSRSHPVIQWRDREHMVMAAGHHLVQHGTMVYMCPQLILHYILHHEYRPPGEFIRAALSGRFLKFDDLTILPPGGMRQ